MDRTNNEMPSSSLLRDANLHSSSSSSSTSSMSTSSSSTFPLIPIPPSPLTAAAILASFPWNEPPISTGCMHIDSLLGGGLPRGGITELVGEAGAGKSGFCMQLAVRTALPKSRGGHGSGTLYVNCEGSSLAVERMVEIAEAEIRRTNNTLSSDGSGGNSKSKSSSSSSRHLQHPAAATIPPPLDVADVLKNITILSAGGGRDELSNQLGQIKLLLTSTAKANESSSSSSATATTSAADSGSSGTSDGNSGKQPISSSTASSSPPSPPRIRLLILDSVASVYRLMDNTTTSSSSMNPSSSSSSFGELSADGMDRARGLLSLAAILKSFSVEFGVTVVVTNQISDVLDDRLPLSPPSHAWLPPLALSSGTAEGSGGGGSGSGATSSSAVAKGVGVVPPLPPATAAVIRTLSAIPTEGRWVRPALGLTWDNCVTTRVFMTRASSSSSSSTASTATGSGAVATTSISSSYSFANKNNNQNGNATTTTTTTQDMLDFSDVDFEAFERDVANDISQLAQLPRSKEVVVVVAAASAATDDDMDTDGAAIGANGPTNLNRKKPLVNVALPPRDYGNSNNNKNNNSNNNSNHTMAGGGFRVMYVLLSPSVPLRLVRYGITTEGIRGTSPPEKIPWLVA